MISSINAHGYGLSWFENIRVDGLVTFIEHEILPKRPIAGDPDQFSQLHGLDAGDLDGDGLDDFVTGKTFWTHNGTDPGARDPAVLYAFLTRRTASGVQFIRQRVDSSAGIGRQVVVRDLNGDGRAEIFVGNKKGASLFRNR